MSGERTRWMRGSALVGVTVGLLLALFGGTAPAYAGQAWWGATSGSWPASLSPGGDGRIVVTAENLGDAPVQGGGSPVIVRDMLPEGLTVREHEVGGRQTPEIEGVAGEEEGFYRLRAKSSANSPARCRRFRSSKCASA